MWRHSPSPELRAFVKLFKPHRIIPNTLDPDLENLDWIAIDNAFWDCLSLNGKLIVESIREDVAKNMPECGLSAKLDSWVDLVGDGDTALKNLEGGNEAIELATQWIPASGEGLNKLQRIQEHLPESLKIRLEKGISQARAKVQTLAEGRLGEESQARSERSVETETDFYDDRGSTAHRIFAGSSFIRSEGSSSAPAEEEAGFFTPVSSPRNTQNRDRSLTASPTPPSKIFNQEYEDWFNPVTPPKQWSKLVPKTPEPKKMMNVLSHSTNTVVAVRSSTTSKLHPAATQSSTSQTLLPSNPVPTPSLASRSTASTLSPSSKNRSSKTPPPVNTGIKRDRRRAEREERRRIALKLGRARPDLVSKEFAEKFLESIQEELC